MCCLHKIYEGKLSHKGSESFRFTVKGFTRVKGAFCSAGNTLSLAFANGKKVVIDKYEAGSNSDVPPNKRPLLFDKPLQMELITGVISGIDELSPAQNQSVYLILE